MALSIIGRFGTLGKFSAKVTKPVWTVFTLTSPTELSSYTSANLYAKYAVTFTEVTSVLSGLGLTLNSFSGYCTITGTPNNFGTFSVTIRASNLRDSTDQTFSLVVAPAVPVWTISTITHPLQASSFTSSHLTATNALSFTESTSVLSGLGLTLNSYAGYCTITGTPNTYGTFSVTLVAHDGSATASRAFSLVIDPAIPVWVTTTITDPVQNTVYSSGNLVATYGQTFSQTSGTTLSSLGLILTSSSGHCTISGTPNTSGTFSITLTATNGTATKDQVFSLVIDPVAPVWTVTSLSAHAVQNSVYTSPNLTATNGLTFTEVSSALTGLGLVLTSNSGYCVISGTPTSSGTYSITLRATNGTATTDQSFSLVIDVSANIGVDAFWNNVSCYLPLNNSVTDSSGNNLIVSNPSSFVTFSNSVNKYQPYSASFNGSSSYLYVNSPASSTNFSGDFTIECWINASSLSANQLIFDTRLTANSSTGFAVCQSSTTGTLYIFTNGGNLVTGTINMSIGGWHHIAVTRHGSTITLFTDGVANGSASSTSNFSDGILYIGRQSTSANSYFNGYMSDFRITNGFCRYSSNFTVPSTSYSTTPETFFSYDNIPMR